MHTSPRSQRILYWIIAVILMLAFLPSPSPVSAQPTRALVEAWRNTDFSFNSVMLDIDSHNNAYVLGDTPATNILSLRKFSVSSFGGPGTLLWQTTYDPEESLRGVWVAADNDGNAIVSANIVRATDGQSHGLLTLKYDPDGSLLWANSLPGSFSGAVRAEVDANNNIYVAGFTFNDSLLIKYSPSGTVLWSATFDNNGAVDQAYSMAVSPDSSRIAVAGKSGNLFMALMYDADGNRLWANTSTAIYPANSVAFGPGNVSHFAAGTYLAQDPNPYQMTIVKFDASGSQVWAKNYNVGDRATRIVVDVLGNIVATGVDQVNGGYTDWMTIKTDANGNLLWSQRYDGGRNNDEIPNMLVLGASGEVYVTGTGGPNPSSGTLSYLKGVAAKYNSDGTPQWAVWDPYAGGKAIQLLNVGITQVIPGFVTLGFGYLTTTAYTQTGLTDLVPAAPTNLTGTASASDVTLNFSDNATDEFWVDIERCAGAECTNFAKIGQTRGEDAASFRDTTVSAGTTYTYRVQAMGFMGGSGYSNSVTFTIAGSATPPPAPGNLSALAVSKTQINLSWTNNSTNQTGVMIERCRGATCTNFSLIATVTGTATTYSDSGLAGNTAYRYRVIAYNSAGSSLPSNLASAKTLKR